MPAALREDALTATSAGFELRIGLPWIRSMPLSSISELTVSVDGRSVDPSELRVLIGGRRVAPADLHRDTTQHLEPVIGLVHRVGSHDGLVHRAS